MKKILLVTWSVLLAIAANAQSYTNTKQIRFFAITTASDTAATVANSGRMWYDGSTHHFRVNVNGVNEDLGSGSGGGGGPLTINEQVASYQLALADGTNTLVRMNVAGANNLTVPANATIAFPIGTIITIEQINTGLTTVVAAGGVTVTGSAGNLFSPGEDTPMVLVKTGTNTWDLWNGSPGITSGNGLTLAGSVMELGGTLDQNTTVTGAFDLAFSTNSLTAEDLRGGNTTDYVKIDGTIADQISLIGSGADINFSILSKGEGYIQFAGTTQLAGLQIQEISGELFVSEVGLSTPSGVTGMTLKAMNGNSATNTGANNSLVAGDAYTVSGNGAGGSALITVGQRRTAGSGVDGSIVFETRSASGTLKLNDGANEQMGVATLVGGTVTVNNSKVTANTRIQLTHQAPGGTIGVVHISARVAGTSFTITSSSALDTSVIFWQLWEPN